MTTRLTFPASMFSVVCQRCGSTVRKNADSCPNCGAERGAAFGEKREAHAGTTRNNHSFGKANAPLASAAASASIGARGHASDRVEPDMRSRWTERASERIAQKASEYRTRRAEEAARNAYAESSNDADALPGSERWSRKKTVVAGACGLVLLLGAMFYYQLGDSDHAGTPSADHSVSGAIDAKVGALMRGAADSASTDRHASADTHVFASGDALQTVRSALDQHDLGSARARLKTLPAQQQARPDYETLKDELVKRELQRDAALQLARACERTSAWACVKQNAGEALALDGSNIESQAMLERVISHAGWLAPSAAAALAKKVPGSADTTTAAAAAPRAGTAAPSPVPAQANVAVATRPNANVSANATAQRSATERRAAQRSAAARPSDDDTRTDTAYESRAEKLARGQAATNALTASVVPPAPTVATTMTPPAQPAAPPQTTAKSSAPAPRAPYYIGEEETRAPAAANAHAATPRAPYYLGDETSQATRGSNPHGAYYLGEDPPQQAAPPAKTAAPRPSQPANQSSSIAPSGATMPAAAQPQRVPVAQTNATARSTQPAATVATTATSPAFANMSTSDKSEDLERAIKQYGWSGGQTAAKPSH